MKRLLISGAKILIVSYGGICTVIFILYYLELASN